MSLKPGFLLFCKGHDLMPVCLVLEGALCDSHVQVTSNLYTKVKLSSSHPSKQCATVKTHLFAIKTQPHMCPLGSLCREHCHGHRPGRLVLPPRILLFMRAAGRWPQSSEKQMQKGESVTTNTEHTDLEEKLATEQC